MNAPLTTYQQGYRAHVDGRPREVAPHEDREWLRGWDAAERDKTRGREILAASGSEVWRPER